MRIAIAPEDEAVIAEALRSGRFATPGEVVHHGLRLVAQREARLAELRDLVDEALAEGGSLTDGEVADSLARYIAGLPDPQG